MTHQCQKEKTGKCCGKCDKSYTEVDANIEQNEPVQIKEKVFEKCGECDEGNPCFCLGYN